MAAGSKSRYLFEIVGTFLFVFVICSAATVYSGSNKLVGIVGLGQLAMAVLGLVHAFVLTALVYAINARSGAQLNPAVTIAFLVSRKMRGKVEALTIACKLYVAVIGAAVLY